MNYQPPGTFIDLLGVKRVVILRGVPGSGKSSHVEEILAVERASGPLLGMVYICSADNFFMKQGVYCFDRSQLGRAHGHCLRTFASILNFDASKVADKSFYPADVLVVDNTNTTPMEIQPYAALCAAYEKPFEVVTIKCDPELAAARNTHGVPREKVWEMHHRLKDAYLPKHWPQRTIDARMA